MKILDIRKLKDSELSSELESRQRALMDLRFKKVTSALKDVSQMRNIRRDIARIKTVIREREIISQLSTEGETA